MSSKIIFLHFWRTLCPLLKSTSRMSILQTWKNTPGKAKMLKIPVIKNELLLTSNKETWGWHVLGWIK